jgi:uncharacterized protein YlzI (FlbEa/FlbD family)
MIPLATSIVLHLVLLHTIDGRETLINPEQVASMTHRSADKPNKLLTDGVECVIELSNGKFVSVIEHCDEVQQKLEEAGK